MVAQSLNIIQELKSVLAYHRLSGIGDYPRNEVIESFLNARPPRPEPERGQNPAPGVQVTRKPPAERRDGQKAKNERQQAPEHLPHTTIEDIAGEVAVCTGCELRKQRIVPVPGRGGEKVRLLVVGDWLAVAGTGNMVSGMLFGIEQDRMLGKMIDAIRMPREQVFVTNVIKCGIPQTSQPKAEHVHACYSYLVRQIAVLRPEVILSMGLIATRALLNRKEPLSRLRGRLHTYAPVQGENIPLIATYHPTFLLQNPEMKKATWVDLQILAKQLGLSTS